MDRPVSSIRYAVAEGVLPARRRGRQLWIPLNAGLRYLEDLRDVADARQALAEARTKGVIPYEEVRRALGLT